MTKPKMLGDRFRAMRAGLLAEFSDLPGQGSALAFQRHLADAILDAESQISEVIDGEICRRHIHLLRSIGDALAWSVLPAHTIRALRRHPGPHASLRGQQDDSAFVFAVAEKFLAGGFLPICSDLTHVLRVGDIVAYSPDRTAILECKNSPLPDRIPSGGRAARQRMRGEERAEYLTRSYAEEQDGTVRVALPGAWPSPNWRALQRALAAVDQSPDGFGIAYMGTHDWLVALRRPDPSSDAGVPARFRRLLARHTTRFKIPTIGFPAEVIDEPSEFVCSPLAYPVSADVKAQFLEGSLLLIRMVDLARLEAQLLIAGDQCRLEVTDSEAPYPILATIGSIEIPLSFRHVSTILLTPVSVRAMRHSLLLNLRRWRVAKELFQPDRANVPHHLLATGDSVIYATVFRGQSGEPLVVTPASDIGLNVAHGDKVPRRPDDRARP